MQLEDGSSGGYFSRPSTGNSLSNVLVQANTISSLIAPGNPNFTLETAVQNAGINVMAGWEEPGNSVNGISIANNDVNTPFIGIGVVGGTGVPRPTERPSFPGRQ